MCNILFSYKGFNFKRKDVFVYEKLFNLLYALEYYNVKLADKEKSMMLFFEDEEYII